MYGAQHERLQAVDGSESTVGQIHNAKAEFSSIYYLNPVEEVHVNVNINCT